MTDPKDICYCGDYREDHKGGTGACKYNDHANNGGLGHGFKKCMEFRTATPPNSDAILAALPDMIADQKLRIAQLEAAIRLVTYKDGNAIRVAWDESKDLAVAHPVLMAVHNST